MTELVSEEATPVWGLKTHGLMRDVPLQDGGDQQVRRPGLLVTASL